MNIKQIEKRISRIVQQEGRRPRILLVSLEWNQSNHWTKPLAAFLAESGFDVDIGPEGLTPLHAARLAIDNDVHMICVSVSNTAHQALVDQLANTLQAEGGSDIRLVVGSTGLQHNHDEYYLAGVDPIVNLEKADINLIDSILDLFDESGDEIKSKA
ncbi:MAG: hypothetical protein PVI00_05610 [Desulfobacterales bacterium]|jgi:methylmalonyl-CoA mutase